MGSGRRDVPGSAFLQFAEFGEGPAGTMCDWARARSTDFCAFGSLIHHGLLRRGGTDGRRQSGAHDFDGERLFDGVSEVSSDARAIATVAG